MNYFRWVKKIKKKYHRGTFEMAVKKDMKKTTTKNKSKNNKKTTTKKKHENKTPKKP